MNLTELKRQLEAADEPTTKLLDTLYSYCTKKKCGPESILSSFKPIIRAAWETAMKAHPYEAPREKDGARHNDVVDYTFYVCRGDTENPSHELYPIRDHDLRLLGDPIIYDTLTNTKATTIGKAMNDCLTAVGQTPTYNEVKQVKEALGTYFMHSQTDNPRPAFYAQPQDPGYALARRTIQPDYNMLMPDWDRYLSGFEDPEAYAAKIYAIVMGLDDSRQALVIRSVGKTGKSCAMAAITSIYGNPQVAKAITGTHVSQSSRFLASNYRHAALIYSPDCNSNTFLLSEVVKQLTGADRVAFELKGGAYGEYDAKAKLIVNMNPRPKVLAEQHSISRILYLEQSEIPYSDVGSAEFTRLLTEQLPAFLAYGEQAYAKKWHNKMCQLNEAAMQTFTLLVGGEREEFNDFVFERYSFGPDLSLDGAEFTRAINRKQLSQFQRDEWREWLGELDGVSKEKTGAKVRYVGIGKRGTSASAAASGEMDDA